MAPFLPAPRDAAELRAQLPGSGALTFPTARPALAFPNPALGVGKPLRATQCDLLAGQAGSLSGCLGRRGFADSLYAHLTVSLGVGVTKKRL